MAISLQETATLYICAIRRVMKESSTGLRAGADRSQARAKARLFGADTAVLIEAEKSLRKARYLKSGFSKSDLVPTELGMRVACPSGLGRAKKRRR